MEKERLSVYKHRVDKKEVPICNILGVKIAAIDMEWLLDFTQRNISQLRGDYMCVSNVHTTVMSDQNPNYKRIQNGGIMAIPDGGPLSAVGRRRGFTEMKRTTGPDYMGEVLKLSVEHGYKHFFYGSTDETLEKLRTKLEKDYPGVKMEMYSPPFRKLSPEEDEEIMSKINATQSDFVWVGLGAPKQEEWMAEHQGKIQGFMVGVGAAFDYYAGNISRAPEWMQKCNLEWLYRLFQDPKRLFKRYLNTNARFLWNVVIKGR